MNILKSRSFVYDFDFYSESKTEFDKNINKCLLTLQENKKCNKFNPIGIPSLSNISNESEISLYTNSMNKDIISYYER